MTVSISKDELKQAAKDGTLEKVKALVQMEETNEVTEAGDLAESQFGRGLGKALDGFQRACAEIDKLP